MIGLIRAGLLAIVLLTAVYLLVSVYSRSVRREKLEKAYDAAPVAGMSRDEYVQRGIEAYNSGLRPKLLLLIYVVPTVIVAVTVYITNAN